MGLYCILCGKKDKSVSYLRFPSDKHIREQWLKFCKKNENNVYDSHRLCTDHFKPEDLRKRSRCLVVQEGAVPCIYSVKEHLQSTTVTENTITSFSSDTPIQSEVVSKGDMNECTHTGIDNYEMLSNHCLTPLKRKNDAHFSCKKRCLHFDSTELVTDDADHSNDSTFPLQELPVRSLRSRYNLKSCPGTATMVGCAAPFCNNSSVKGYTMKIFPRDVKRRAQWAANMNRVNWTPTNNSYLCEVHFAPEMWERRMDNKRKLKPYAVPTIFGFFIKEKVKFPEATEKGNLPESDLVYDVQNQDESEKMTKIVIVTSNASTIGTCDNEVYEETDLKATGKNKSLSKNHDFQHLDDNKKMATNLVVTSNTSIINTCDNKVRKDPKATERDKNLFERDTVHDLQDLDGNKEMATNVIIKPSISIINANKNRERETKGEKYCKINQGKQHNLIYLRKQNKALRNQIQKLKNIIINNKYRLALKKILTDDQIKALFTKTRRIRNWSNKTIQRALQLKFTCGSSGYNELRREGIPLPGLRTLRRKIENLKFGSEISSNNRN